MRAKFLVGCFASAVLPFIFLTMPGVDRWRAIPAFAFSGILFWIYFSSMAGNDEESTVNSESGLRPLEPTKSGDRSERHHFRPLWDMDPKEALKALSESCIAEQLSDRADICILIKKHPLPDIAVWQAALDQFSCGVTLHNSFSIAPNKDAMVTLRADFAGNQYSFEASFSCWQEMWNAPPAGFDDDDWAVWIGTSQTDLREWVCLLFVVASLANTVNGLIIDHSQGDDAPVTVGSTSLLQRARTLVNAGFPESVFPRSHWSGPETTLD